MCFPKSSGETGIRTQEDFRPTCFQDKLLRPLGHFSRHTATSTLILAESHRILGRRGGCGGRHAHAPHHMRRARLPSNPRDPPSGKLVLVPGFDRDPWH